MMMQPTHLWDFPDWAKLWPLDRPRHGTIHGQRPVRTPLMVIAEVVGQEPPQMVLVQDHYVVQAVAAETPNQPFDGGILPRTPRSDDDVFDPVVLKNSATLIAGLLPAWCILGDVMSSCLNA
jgi:hypothetical protein